jgi:hypothetical protein
MGGDYTSARVADVFDGTFECRSCGLSAPAVVSSSGRGSAHGHGADDARAALRDGMVDANSVAARSLTFLPCPKCGVVDPSARSYRVQVIVGSLLLGAVSAGVMYYLFTRTLDEGRSTAGYGPIAAVVGGVVTAAAYWWWGRCWRNIRRRVWVDRSRETFTEVE